jgi:outer membrane protein TolC
LNVPVLNASTQLGANGASVDLPGVNMAGKASGNFYDYGVVLSLRQPLFDGGISRSSTELAQRRAERTAVALDQARQAIVQNVQSWYASHQALLRYRAGIVSINELLLAQRNLQLARTAQAVATHRWNLSRAGLELETGGEQQSLPSAEPGGAAAYSSVR